MQNKLSLLDASVRHLGTDINYIVLDNLYNELSKSVDFYFNTVAEKIEITLSGYGAFADFRSIENYIEEAELGECEVKIHIG